MPRPTIDLIHELQSEAVRFTTLQLVVGFNSTSIFINADDTDGVTKLNQAIEAGGEPIGLIGAEVEREKVTVYSRCLEEHRGKQWAEDYLHRIAQDKAGAIGAVVQQRWMN